MANTDKKINNGKADRPADHEPTITNAPQEKALQENETDLDATNKAYNTSVNPDDKDPFSTEGNKNFESYGSEFGADPAEADKTNSLQNENDNVNKRTKKDDKDLNSR